MIGEKDGKKWVIMGNRGVDEHSRSQTESVLSGSADADALWRAGPGEQPQMELWSLSAAGAVSGVSPSLTHGTSDHQPSALTRKHAGLY